MEVHLGGKLVAAADSEPIGISGNISIVFCPEEMLFLSFLPSIPSLRSLLGPYGFHLPQRHVRKEGLAV